MTSSFSDLDRLAMLIADFSGKGIPTALFMALSRILFKNICFKEKDPAVALDKTNFVLCQDSDAYVHHPLSCPL